MTTETFTLADLFRCLIFWRQCPCHRAMRSACFCCVKKGQWTW